MAEEKTLTFKEVSKKPSRDLNDGDLAIIAQEAEKESEIERKKAAGEPVEEEKKEEVKEKKEEEQKKEEPTEEEKAKEAEEAKAKKEQEEQEAKAKEDLKKRAVELGLKEDATKGDVEAAEIKKKDEDFQKDIMEYAKSKNIRIEDAKATLESFAKIKDRLSKNEREVLEEYLSLQRSSVNLGRELKALKDKVSQTPPPELTTDNVLKALKAGKFKSQDGKVANPEDVIASFRQGHPDITENLDDEAPDAA